MNSRLRLAALAAVLILIATATTLAHMKAAKFEPADKSTVTTPPSRIQVWFTQPPDPKLSRLDLAGPSGTVNLTDVKVTADKSIVATIDGSVPDGPYTVRWQSAGNDGHLQKGEFAFTVRRAH